MTNKDLIARIKDLLERRSYCPSCGCCPTCGRDPGGQIATYQWPPYQWPHYYTYTGGAPQGNSTITSPESTWCEDK